MKGVISFGIGLAIGAAVVGGFMALRQGEAPKEKTDNESVRKELDEAREALKKATQRLVAAEEKNIDLAERLAQAQRERTSGKAETPAVAPQPPPSAPTPVAKGEFDVRKLAKSLVKMIKMQKEMKDHDWKNLSPEQQREMMAVNAEMMTFMAKARFNMQNPYEMFANAESRQMVVDFATALLEEVGVAGDRGKIDALLTKLGEGSKIQEDASLSDLERVVEGMRLKVRLAPEVENLFSAQDREIIRRELTEDALNGLMNLGGGMVRGVGSSSTGATDKRSATESIVDEWSQELHLGDSEKQIVVPVADRYMTEYILLKTTLEAEAGKEFADLYFERARGRNPMVLDGKSTEEIAKEREEAMVLWEKRQEMRRQPEFRAKEAAANLKFWELQLKYQNELKGTLGAEKAELLNKMRPTLRHFPGLE